MADLQDAVFFAFSIIYTAVLEKNCVVCIFKTVKAAGFFVNCVWWKMYVIFRAVIAIFLLLLYIVFEGHKYTTKVSSAVPHLFLFCTQVFMEGMTITWNFSLPIQLFVPIFYNSRGLFTIDHWLVADFTF
ncbi:hypothetical protein ZOSMA_105G00710 [Zostera marina]|uniref:DUF7733 domain-containing protein n=1 Tax=Zostera marina TaxID=29655 RepID=A0A0K9Q667_ZOSMR|nr:hypothetical protein ZOSMA_105G00710 [Zostera marina]